MSQKFLLPAVAFLSLLFSGCTTTFFGTVVIITFRDILLYVVLALLISFITSVYSHGNKKVVFWICFILSLVLTPLAGLIYLLILLSKREKPSGF